MDCIKKLQKIGIKEINNRTKIASKRLEDIFECKFDELDKTRAKGFIHILEREYKLDMSEWLEKYNEYQAQKEEEIKISESEKVNNKENKINISFVDTTIKDKIYIRLVIVFLVLVMLFLAYFIYNNLISNKETTQNPSEQIGLNSQNYKADNNSLDDNSTTLDSLENSVFLSQDSLSSNNEDLKNLKEDNSSIKLMASQNQENIHSSKNDSIAENIDLAPKPLDINVNDAFIQQVEISPKMPLWVGVIDLDSSKKKQVSISKKYAINLDKSKLIITGHGYFDIEAPDMNKQFISGDSKYFIYTKDDGFKEITKSEFLSFNRGEEW